ncbi:B-cell receptor-associated protein 31-like-domain-containing protein [Schizothecium vesticola]|uniref:Endoplasmic reticulum transmembrane protein n=1 Tax=Schizothecium vesticola TaxID=314040 RepID=A0AA40KAC0_9PEZI|nr:B-cell receptor-associated protein 31-like-domain-containing protein [Schizothecium vesticola]
MTLYFTLVFMLLVAEMALFMLLIIPIPFTIKRKMFTFISESPLVAKAQHILKITFVFILILFIDSVNRVYRVQLELALATENNNGGGHVSTSLSPLTSILTRRSKVAVMGHERLEVQARKFYSQRNMYLCGFTLFLSLILNRTYIMILETLRLEEKLKQYEGTDRDTKQAEKLAVAGEPGEIARLKRELKQKDQEIERIKEQAAGVSREYDRVTDIMAEQEKAGGGAGARKSK